MMAKGASRSVKRPSFPTGELSIKDFREAMSIRLRNEGSVVHDDGTITLYHVTTTELAESILKEGFFRPSAAPTGTGTDTGPSAYFGIDKQWVEDIWSSSGARESVLEVRVPVEYIRKGAQNNLEVYFEGGLRRMGDVWVPEIEPRETHYDRMAVKKFLRSKKG